MNDPSHHTLIVKSPGRVNLLGEHVDYNSGMVLPAAIDRYVHIEAVPSPEPFARIEAIDLNSACSIPLDQLERKLDADGHPLPDWALYPAGVAWVLKSRGYDVAGFSARMTSRVPIGAGLSSSAAVEVGFAVLWQALGGWQMDRMKLAQACQEAENRYVGVNCGLMDQFACANGVKDHAMMLDTRTLRTQPVPLPEGTALVIADSGVRRSLTNSAYNERRKDCEAAVRLLKPIYPSIHALRDISPLQLDACKEKLPQTVYKRARHVVSECGRVQKALDLLQLHDSAGFGRLMVETHYSLRDDYEVSCTELDALVETALKLPGCLGARLTGAGFGGCTVNLVQEDALDEFIPRLGEGYAAKTGRLAKVYLCHASQGAFVEK